MKKEALDQMKKAKAAGSYMLAVWTVEDGKLGFYRLTNNFPLADMQEAMQMLIQDLEPMTIENAVKEN